MYLTPLSEQSGTSDVLTPAPTEPVNLLAIDGNVRFQRWGLTGELTHFGKPIQNTVSFAATDKVGWLAMADYRLPEARWQRVSLVAGVESAPLFSVYAAHPEVRFLLGVRVGGSGTGSGWINMPSLRQGMGF
jgi:hypothetical protein